MPFKTPESSVRPHALAAILPAVLLVGAASAAAAPPRVVVLGFDGADHALVAKMIAEGKLPNLAALAQKGGFTELLPTIPAQTPVSWSTFSTGLSPGRTMIFDFLKRNPKTYRPEFAIAEEGKKDFLLGKNNRVGIPAALGGLAFLVVWGLLRIFLGRRVKGPGAREAGAASAASASTPSSRRSAVPLVAGLVAAAVFTFTGISFSSLLPTQIPFATNNRRGTPFWELAGARGIHSVVMHVPVTFPAVDYDNGRLISGLGVPDVRGRIGTPSYYTSDPFFAPKNKNEFSVEL
ncbi:MAG TPA: alkaline phosphatase family protein, partial [Thermoanaerobaculia bacterium]|nr:alkaline phosphatase family protein [Thermoanaerobaculia bacterium]